MRTKQPSAKRIRIWVEVEAHFCDESDVPDGGASVRFNKPQQVMLDHNEYLHVIETDAFWTRRLKYTAIST